MKDAFLIFAKITIPAVLIYIVILLTFQNCSAQNCSTNATEVKAGYNRSCFTPADVSPPANGETKEPASAPEWNNVHRAKEFWTTVHNQPKNVVLFGTYYCAWCRATEKWWDENGVVDGWQFTDWNLLKSDSDETEKEFIKTLEDIYFTRNPKNSEIGFPTCAVLVNAQPGKSLTESVVYTGLGFDECAQMMKEFIISVNPHTQTDVALTVSRRGEKK